MLELNSSEDPSKWFHLLPKIENRFNIYLSWPVVTVGTVGTVVVGGVVVVGTVTVTVGTVGTIGFEMKQNLLMIWNLT